MPLTSADKLKVLDSMGTKALTAEIMEIIPKIQLLEGLVDNQKAEIKYAQGAQGVLEVEITDSNATGKNEAERKRAALMAAVKDARWIAINNQIKGFESLLFSQEAELGALRRKYQALTYVLQLKTAQINFLADVRAEAVS